MKHWPMADGACNGEFMHICQDNVYIHEVLFLEWFPNKDDRILNEQCKYLRKQKLTQN